MSLPRPVVLGNWKMNVADDDLLPAVIAAPEGGTLGVFPPAIMLAETVDSCKDSPVIVGAQDCHREIKGAFTGSISAGMIKATGATAVLVGHSERRHGLGETNADVLAKAEAALDAGLLVVLCIGETEDEWLAGKRMDVLARQLEESCPRQGLDRIVIAYEPVWAIGTGRTPELADIEETHKALRRMMAARSSRGADCPLLYGGSVKPGNAAEILAIADVDGALVGGASLKAADFIGIYKAGLAG